MMLLVPADPLRPRRVDEHFAPEADAAREAGHVVALIDHDALTRPGSASQAVARVPPSERAVYRGWMLRSEQYSRFAAALADREVSLRTTPSRYRQAHELPSWYPALADWTPTSVWTTGTDPDDFALACARLGPGPAVLRDYCKSMKHYWHSAAYLPEATDQPAAWSVASRFRELRGEDLVGGFVIRRFEPFGQVEVRTWWIDGVCRLVTAHPDTPGQSCHADLDLTGVRSVLADLGLPFVAVDFARRTDGVWRVVELGDGQVSDRPTSTDPADLIAALDCGETA